MGPLRITDNEATRLAYLWRNDPCCCRHRRRVHVRQDEHTNACTVYGCGCRAFALDRAELEASLSEDG